MNACAIEVAEQVVWSHKKVSTAGMTSIEPKQLTGRDTSRMSAETKALHAECVYYYDRDRRQWREAERDVGLKPGTLGRIKDEGPVAASIRCTAPTSQDDDLVIIVDMQRIQLCERALKKLPDMQRKAIDAYYISGCSYKAVMRACKCGFDQARHKIRKARERMLNFYDDVEHKLG